MLYVWVCIFQEQIIGFPFSKHTSTQNRRIFSRRPYENQAARQWVGAKRAFASHLQSHPVKLSRAHTLTLKKKRLWAIFSATILSTNRTTQYLIFLSVPYCDLSHNGSLIWISRWMRRSLSSKSPAPALHFTRTWTDSLFGSGEKLRSRRVEFFTVCRISIREAAAALLYSARRRDKAGDNFVFRVIAPVIKVILVCEKLMRPAFTWLNCKTRGLVNKSDYKTNLRMGERLLEPRFHKWVLM